MHFSHNSKYERRIFATEKLRIRKTWATFSTPRSGNREKEEEEEVSYEKQKLHVILLA